MAKVVILGSSNAVPDENHENTHLAILGESSSVLVDCVNNPVVRLQQAGIAFDNLTDMILTHFHPDHVSGVPLLLMDMWLLGRSRPMEIHGLSHTLDRVEGLMDFYTWKAWPNFFPTTFHRLPETGMHLVIDQDEYRIYTSPVQHLVPTIGLRVEFKRSDKVLAYSCDTEPVDSVVQLAAGADVLIHEAAGAARGHSSATQAAAVARAAEAGALVLIHYPTRGFDAQALVAEAGRTFAGPVQLAEDFMVLEF